jgi:superfamily II DNA or RNA helicase
MSESQTADVPQQGQLVQVRERRWVVADVAADELPPDALEPTTPRQHLLTLRCVDDDAEPDETLRVVWEIEPGARAFERAALPDPKSLDDPKRFDAFLDAVRWGATSNADPRHYLAPFQSGVEIDWYQLDPLVRALRMPRVSLLIADDVGLGKTIEAGLVAQELILRYRARRILVVTPADLQLQWRDEMRDKFGLEFRVVDRELVRKLRRERGIHVNPWTHFPRLITSIDYLKSETPLRRFREALPGPDEPRYPRRFDLLIVDEAHNAAPSGRGRYATDSLRTRLLRELVPNFEHRLFLTATPHNGYLESFTSLLELLDNQRFACGVRPNEEALREVMVRRLKRELPPHFDGTPRFPERILEPITVTYTDEEHEAHSDLVRYTELRGENASGNAEAFATEFVLKLLKKRLFSSPAAFARTLAKHRETVAEASGARTRTKPTQGVLERLVGKTEETYETEDDYQEAEDEAQASSARTFRPFSAEEEQILDRLADWAERASTRADAKAKALLALVENTCRPEGEWNHERLIVFTEYRDTQKWLFDLFAARGLTTNDRTELLYGGMDAEERKRIKAAFQAEPEQSPVRVLLATDAASEGINLQNHCHRIVHYEIPWNPNRLEQRNGRVDRHGQRSSEVLVSHFAPEGWEELEGVESVPVGKLAGDLEFLRRAVVKVEQIREMLGKVGPVIADQVAAAMLGRRRTLDTTNAEKEGEAVRRQLRFERDLRRELERLEESYDETRAEQRLTPEHVRAVVETALELARQPALVENGNGTFGLPQLTGAWTRAADGLAHPFTGRLRPLSFEPIGVDDRGNVVHCHLGHPLVQMSLALLRAEVWQPAEARTLERVTARVVDDPRLRDPVVVVFARLVVTGADGHRLHEELLQAGGSIRDGKLERLGVNALKDALAYETSGAVRDSTGERLLRLFPSLVSPLSSAIEARVKERTDTLVRLVAERRDAEVAKITAVLEELRAQILAELDESVDEQLRLFDESERDQLQQNRDFLRARAEEIPAELERETEALERRFADPEPRVFPVAVEFLVPTAVDRQ